ncbi:hypothetical protein N0V88_006784 [Collariella sp. IMI 366227]|nr:hypothetical protein N0V88_006784 [Collariella sp. IMI 366227]
MTLQAQSFPPLTFAATLISDTPTLFLHSIDTACLERIRATTKYTIYKFDKPVNYEVERWFVWIGVDNDNGGKDGDEERQGRLSIRGLKLAELECQIGMS